MASTLRNLRLFEVSLVDKGANPGSKVVLFKRASGAKVIKSMTLDEALAKLPDDVKAVIVAALAEKAKPAADAPAPGEDMAKRADLPEDVRKALAETADLKKQRDESNERIAKLERDRDRSTMIAKARSFGVVPGYTAEELGGLLHEATEKLEASTVARLEKHLRGMAEIVKAGGVFSEAGSSATGGAQSAGDQITAIAKALREKSPELSLEKAYTVALKQNPELRKQMRAETRAQ